MKKIVSLIVLCLMAESAMAAMTPASGRGRQQASYGQATGRVGMMNAGSNNMRAASMKVQSMSSEATVGKSSLKADNVEADIAINDETQIMGDVPAPEAEPEKDMREKEKKVCLANNIGVGNTFVWASRFSDTSSYVTMIEDVEEPENNVCFVKVEMKSTDPKIDVSDIPGKYFVMGENITCGAWTDEEALRKRILDAKKSARTWATVGGVVGGAAVGVGAMELFGNKAIGGAVEGQYSMNESELLRSQLLVLKKDNPTEYNRYVSALKDVEKLCEDASVKDYDDDTRNICTKYSGLLGSLNSVK
ncbi:MAG: hypothetical protein J6K82_00015 [Alphaproteobacteria bacterium]|nr:hypothetical protein [Alphaproteobacteria bacterium]